MEPYSTAYSRKRRQDLKEKGLCIQCGKREGPLCGPCKAKESVCSRRFRENRLKLGLCIRCGDLRDEHDKANCQACKAKAREEARQKREVFRLEAFEKYGGAFCSCCGESRTECLTFDHVNQDGAEKRRNGETVGVRFYRELCDSPLRSDIRVLCFNCNVSAFRFGGKPRQPRINTLRTRT